MTHTVITQPQRTLSVTSIETSVSFSFFSQLLPSQVIAIAERKLPSLLESIQVQ